VICRDSDFLGGLTPGNDALVFNDPENDAEPALLFTQDTVPNPWYTAMHRHSTDANRRVLRHALPSAYARRRLLWWRSHVVAFVARPTPV
jgi:hypothetical protein